jgi:hypothetical protein
MDVWLNIIMARLMKYSEAFLTGCDEKQEWMLSWFFKNYKKYNDTPLVFADFGMSDTGRAIVRENAHAIVNLSDEKGKGWFLKPKAMCHCPANKSVWIDLDCEIKGDLSPIFDLLVPEKLNMVEDVPWSKRREETWHNSGVVGYIGKPTILKKWRKKVEEKPKVGDQEVPKDPVVVHWTGAKGKDEIRRQMNA